MLYTKQSIEDFTEKKMEVVEQFKKYDELFGWKFKTASQMLDDIEKFFITSGDMSCIITYDRTTKCMRVVNLTSGDLRILNSLKEGL
jgi:hypothetical protein